MIRDVDNGLRRLIARARGLQDVRLTVGVHEDTGAQRHPSGGDVVGAASVIELGTDQRAPVGWLRTTIDERRGTLARDLADAGARVLRGEAPADAFGPVVTGLAKTMRSRIPVDTGTVRDAVEARVDGARVG